MANYYTLLSFELTLEPAQMKWADKLFGAANKIVDDYWDGVALDDPISDDAEIQRIAIDLMTDEAGTVIYDFGFDARYSPSEKSIWIVSEESANMDLIADCIQAVMKRFYLTGYISFEFADTCSKMRLNSFGGGAYVITRHGWDAMGSYGIVNQLVEEAVKKSWLQKPIVEH